MLTPTIISCLSPAFSGQGYTEAWNPSQIFFTRDFSSSPWMIKIDSLIKPNFGRPQYQVFFSRNCSTSVSLFYIHIGIYLQQGGAPGKISWRQICRGSHQCAGLLSPPRCRRTWWTRSPSSRATAFSQTRPAAKLRVNEWIYAGLGKRERNGEENGGLKGLKSEENEPPKGLRRPPRRLIAN